VATAPASTPARDARWRGAAVVLVGWIPLALAAGWAVGELTGCSAYLASCRPPVDLLPWLFAAAILVLLAASPWLARLAAAGGVGVTAASIPVTLALVSSGATNDPGRGVAVLVAMLALAWLGAVVLAIRQRRILRG